MSILEKIKSLNGRGTCIVGLAYEDSKGVETIRNVRLGDKFLSDVPYGEAVTNSLFLSDAGDTLLRAVDHTASNEEKVRVFRLDRIKNITVDGEYITA